MNIRMKYLEELVIEIYGVKLINYHETTDPHSDKPCFELVTGTAAKGLIDELKFTPNYRKRIEDLFTLTFNPDKRIVVKYNDIKYSEIKSKTAKSKTKSDFDQLHMIANFCKFVGIDEFKILDKEYDYAYWYTEESPFEAIEHIDEYAPYVAHVVCCKKSNWPEKAEQLQQSRTVAFPVLEFLKHSKHYQKEFGSIIACILKTKYVPLLFDSIPGVGFDDSKLKDQFETICKQTKYKLLDCLYSKPGRSHNTDIIIVDSTCDKRFDKETKLNPKDPSSGLYDIKREVLPRFYFCIPDLSYRTKRLSPDIDMTGMIQSRYREIKVYLKSGSNLEDNDVVAKDLTNQDSTQMKQRSLLSPELFKQCKALHNRHYLQIMRCIEQVTELVLSLDLVSLINESADEEQLKSFKQCPPINPFKSPIEDKQQAEDEQPFDPSKLSFALLQWIGELSREIEGFSKGINKIYIRGASVEYLEEHVKKLKEYIYNEKLLQTIDVMNNKIEQYGPKEEQPTFCELDDIVDDYTLSMCWGKWQTYRLNTFEKFKLALESYKEKLCDMMNIDEE